MLLSPIRSPVRSPLYSPLAKGGGGITYAPETEALVARFTTPPTTARKGLINDLIVSLKTAGVWSKLDALYLMAAADAQAARRNWIADQYNLTAVASPTFTTDRGYAGDGASSYLSTGFIPASSVGAKFTLNSAGLSATSRTARNAADAVLMGASSASFQHQAAIYQRYTGNVFIGRSNDGGAGVANALSDGRFMVSRQSSASRSGYRNGTSLGTVSVAPTGLAVGTISLGGFNVNGLMSSFSSDQIAQASIGGGLSPSEITAFDAAIAAYLTAIGA